VIEKKTKQIIRRFWSYGPVNPNLHYFAPRKDLIETAFNLLIGDDPRQGGHFVTVWAPRQTGKSWIMLQVLEQFRKNKSHPSGFSGEGIDVVKVDLDLPQHDNDIDSIANSIANDIFSELGRDNPGIHSLKQFSDLFSCKNLEKPLVLIIDEFDALPKDAITQLTRIFRNIYMQRQKELGKPFNKRRYLLHGLALIGIRGALGIESDKGSPFNIQQSLHIPNLSNEEVRDMFCWYEKERHQQILPVVKERLFHETQGQPGLTCWLGELLTQGFEDYSNDFTRSIGLNEFESVLAAATDALPNNNILNIISKAIEESNRSLILEMFQTREKLAFRFDDPSINSLYLNGILDKEKADHHRYYLRFSSPFVQKRLFNYFSREFFRDLGQIVEPFTNLDHVFTPKHLEVYQLMQLYQVYLNKNSSWLFKKAPRRKDLRIYEAIFHFNLYAYLDQFLRNRDCVLIPEFPTGNGKIDLLIQYKDHTYGIELKSFTDQAGYQKALKQAAKYCNQLGLKEIYLVTFVESLKKDLIQSLETPFKDPSTNKTVKPIIIQTGSI
jgi:hypothetical protein